MLVGRVVCCAPPAKGLVTVSRRCCYALPCSWAVVAGWFLAWARWLRGPMEK